MCEHGSSLSSGGADADGASRTETSRASCSTTVVSSAPSGGGAAVV